MKIFAKGAFYYPKWYRSCSGGIQTDAMAEEVKGAGCGEYPFENFD